MNKEEIVNEFLEKGHLLTPRAVDMIGQEGLENFKDRAFDSLVIKENDLYYDSIKIIRNVTKLPKEITKQDFIDAYKKRYETIKNIFVNNRDKKYTSFSNISNGSFNVIGIVKEIKDNGKKVILEDMTGSITVVSNKQKSEKINLDDVVGVELVVRNNVNMARSFYFPDVPLRSAKTSKGSVCCLTDLELKEAPRGEVEEYFKKISEKNLTYVFILSEIEDELFFSELVGKYLYNTHVFHCNVNKSLPSSPLDVSADNVVCLSDPCMVEVNGVNVLCSSKATLDNLKKRYIPYNKLPHDCFLIDKVPDIMLYPDEEPFTKNYKSISLVTAGNVLNKFGPQLINLKSREIETLTI